jgi:putative ABC transport system permease protein
VSFLTLVWAGLFRRRTRTGLTLVSIVVAFLLFGLLRSIANAFSAGVDVAGVDRLIVQPKYSIIDPLPISHLNEIRRVPGVAMATHADWFGGFYQDHKNFFAKYPVKPDEWFAVYPEFRIDPQQLEAFETTRTSAVAPAEMAAKYGWKVGDKIPIEADIYPKKDNTRLWEFDLVGTYQAPGGGGGTSQGALLFNYDYFDEARQFGQGQVGWFIVRVSDPAKALEIARAIDKLFENSANETKTATEAEFARQFANQIGDIGLMMGGILGAVFFTILLLTGNTMAQAFRERVPELAVMKTLGFSDVSVSLLVLAEAVLLCLVGGIVGLSIAALLAPGVATGIKDILPGFTLVWQTVAAGLCIAVVLGLAVGAVPAWTARRLRIVDALREH